MADNERFPVKLFPTATATDVLFYVTQGRLDKRSIPAYGTAYNDINPRVENWPDHKLVYVSPPDRDGKQKWYFAADRAAQDAYNFSYTQADLGGVRFDAVERFYLHLRTEFKETETALAVKQGDAMPNVPASQFAYASFILSERVTSEAPEELKSLYIVEKRTYFRRATISRVEHEDMLGIGQGNVITLYYRGETPSGASGAIETLMSAPSNAFWAVQAGGEVNIGEQLTHRWFAVTTISSLDSALEAYKLSFPSSVDIDIPDELVGVAVVWNSAGQNGSFASEAAVRSNFSGDPEVASSLSESANAECGGSVQPEIIPNIRIRKGRDIPSTAWFFYIKSTASTLSAADVLAKLTTLAGATVLQWPLFQPAQHTFILKGQRGSGRAQVSASGAVSTQVNGAEERNRKDVTSAKGESFDLSTSIGTVVLPPTIHPLITVTNPSPPSSTVYTATCSAGWTSTFTSEIVAGKSIAIPIPSSSGTGNLDPTTGTTGTVTKTATVTLAGGYSPTSLDATTPAAIPTSGLYMVGSPRIEPYKSRWFRCSAQIINANVLA